MALGDFRPVQPIPASDIVLMLVGATAVKEGEMVNTPGGVVICGDSNTAGACGICLANAAAAGWV